MTKCLMVKIIIELKMEFKKIILVVVIVVVVIIIFLIIIIIIGLLRAFNVLIIQLDSPKEKQYRESQLKKKFWIHIDQGSVFRLVQNTFHIPSQFHTPSELFMISYVVSWADIKQKEASRWGREGMGHQGGRWHSSARFFPVTSGSTI